MARALAFTLFCLIMAPAFSSAEPKELCVYKDSAGRIQQVNSRDRVPLSYRGLARCFSEKNNLLLARPQDIELKGTVRKEDMASPLGRIELRWPRMVELLFGRTPQRAMADAAATVSRVLKKAGFPLNVQKLDLDWKVVFMDEKLPVAQIPSYLVNSCHPAWMTPPANIYVIAQRVASGCSGQKASSAPADAQLAEVLIHEIGHAVEYELLGNKASLDRMRSEGFATWFEIYASDFSSIIPRGSASRRYRELARESVRQSPTGFHFAGSAQDYARASLYFSAIVERRGLPGLMSVYAAMRKGGDFLSSVERSLGWDQRKLAQEIQRVL